MSTNFLSRLLCKANARTNEEFSIALKRQRIIMLMLALLGAATIAGAYAVDLFQLKLPAGSSHYFLYGLGSGLIFGALLRIFMIFKFLKNEELLKRERLKVTDEREQEISNRALRMTAVIIALTLYLLIIFCVFAEVTALDLITYLLVFALFCYIICRKLYEKIM